MKYRMPAAMKLARNNRYTTRSLYVYVVLQGVYRRVCNVPVVSRQ